MILYPHIWEFILKNIQEAIKFNEGTGLWKETVNETRRTCHNSKRPVQRGRVCLKYRPRIKEQPVTSVERIYRDKPVIERADWNRKKRSCWNENDILTPMIRDSLLNPNAGVLSLLARNTGSWYCYQRKRFSILSFHSKIFNGSTDDLSSSAWSSLLSTWHDIVDVWITKKRHTIYNARWLMCYIILYLRSINNRSLWDAEKCFIYLN